MSASDWAAPHHHCLFHKDCKLGGATGCHYDTLEIHSGAAYSWQYNSHSDQHLSLGSLLQDNLETRVKGCSGSLIGGSAMIVTTLRLPDIDLSCCQL